MTSSADRRRAQELSAARRVAFFKAAAQFYNATGAGTRPRKTLLNHWVSGADMLGGEPMRLFKGCTASTLLSSSTQTCMVFSKKVDETQRTRVSCADAALVDGLRLNLWRAKAPSLGNSVAYCWVHGQGAPVPVQGVAMNDSYRTAYADPIGDLRVALVDALQSRPGDGEEAVLPEADPVERLREHIRHHTVVDFLPGDLADAIHDVYLCEGQYSMEERRKVVEEVLFDLKASRDKRADEDRENMLRQIVKAVFPDAEDGADAIELSRPVVVTQSNTKISPRPPAPPVLIYLLNIVVHTKACIALFIYLFNLFLLLATHTSLHLTPHYFFTRVRVPRAGNLRTSHAAHGYPVFIRVHGRIFSSPGR